MMESTCGPIVFFRSYAEKRKFLLSELAIWQAKAEMEHETCVAAIRRCDPDAADRYDFTCKTYGKVGERATLFRLNAIKVALHETPEDETPLPNDWPASSIIFDPSDSKLVCWAKEAEQCGQDGLRALGFRNATTEQKGRLNAALSRLSGKPVGFGSFLYFSGVADACLRTVEVEECNGEMIASVSPVVHAGRGISSSPLSGKPHLCYFVKITRVADGASVYKIGITSTSVAHRFHKETGIEITVLASWAYSCKSEAEKHEASVEVEHAAAKAGETAKGFLSYGGWTECFTRDVLGLDGALPVAA